jgi:hypothetical protein
MVYSKQSLAEAKKKLREEDPSFFNKESKPKDSRKKIIRNSSHEKKKKIVIWNYKVNDIVTNSMTGQIGLIVSDSMYFGRAVEKNYFFVLFGCAVCNVDGKFLRQI